MAPARPIRAAAIVAAVAVVSLGADAASAAERKQVALGDYQAVPKVPAEQAYKVGVFSVVKSGAKRRIVATEQFGGIFYPDAEECDTLDVPLTIESVPISRSGRFQVRERTLVEAGKVRVNWKGRWTKPGAVKGSITIKHDGCRSTHRWIGGKVRQTSAPLLPD